MRDEVPAALPLIAFAAALGVGPLLDRPALAGLGLAAIALLTAVASTARRGAIVAFTAFGLLVAAHEEGRRAVERRTITASDAQRFAMIEAPIERDWAARPHLFVLRASRFTTGGVVTRAPLTIYARFQPPRIGMERTIRAEGHLRPDRRGGYTLSLKSARLMSYHGRLLIWSPEAWNRIIANRLREHAEARPEEIAMIEALLLGRGERLSEQTKEDFKRGGTYHLLVFSGLQISLAAGVIAMLLRWVGAARAADWSLLAFALAAPPFVGQEASVSRASTAIALYAVSRIARRPTTFENLWCVAALARLILVPADLYEPAFHLTYAGAGALLFIGRPLARTRLRWVAYAVAAEIAIAPLTLFHFHQYALGGSITTILMTPVVFVTLLTGGVFAALEWPPLLDLVRFLNAVCTLMNGLSSPGFGFFAAPPAPAMIAAFGIAAGAIGLLRGKVRTATIILALLAPPAIAAAIFHRRAEVDAPRVLALDVGQGDALLLRSGRRNLLIDGGGRRQDPRFGENVLLPLLLDRGVRTVDVAILSHAHPDHCVGLAAAIRHLNVRELWLSPRRLRGECAHLLLEAAQARHTPIRLLRGGETVRHPGLTAQTIVLNRHFRRSPDNNSSVLVRARIGRRSILLTGDIERDAERELAGLAGPADVLKVPHHGSRTSTSPALLGSVRPRLAIISCGLHNFFGHPHPDVLAELRRRRIRVWRTDRSGTLEVVFHGGRIEVLPEIDTPR